MGTHSEASYNCSWGACGGPFLCRFVLCSEIRNRRWLEEIDADTGAVRRAFSLESRLCSTFAWTLAAGPLPTWSKSGIAQHPCARYPKVWTPASLPPAFRRCWTGGRSFVIHDPNTNLAAQKARASRSRTRWLLRKPGPFRAPSKSSSTDAMSWCWFGMPGAEIVAGGSIHI